MSGPPIPRQRPYWDACADCPGTPRVPPVLVAANGPEQVVADYVCPREGHVWSAVWARDEQPEGRAS